MWPPVHAPALMVALGVLGCGDAPSAPALPAEETIIDAVGSDAPIVVVLDAGRAPRRALEQPPIPGERDVELALDMSALGRPSSAPSTIHVRVRWSTSAAADVPWRFDVERAEVKMAGTRASGAEHTIVDAITAMYGQIAGHARRLGPAHLEIVQTQGVTTQPAVPWLLHLFAFAPPSEPLGVGATWTTASASQDGDQPCSESRRYEVTGIDAQEIIVMLAVQLRCGPAPGATSPSPTVRYEIDGELRFAPSDGLALAGDLTSTLTTTFPALVDDAGEPRELEAKLRFGLVTTSE